MADFVKSGERISANWANDIVKDLRRLGGGSQKKKIIVRGGGTGTDCYFGSVYLSGGKGYLKGGIVYAGPDNINVPDIEITLAPARNKILYFEIPITANRDDNNEIILPGIESNSWTPALEEATVSSGYPSNTGPSLPSGAGTIIVPLGTLTTTASAISLVAAACGNIILNQCAGQLSFTRGGA